LIKFDQEWLYLTSQMCGSIKNFLVWLWLSYAKVFMYQITQDLKERRISDG